MIAREKGLEPLADLIFLQEAKEPLEETAASYVSEEKGVDSVKTAIAGAKDILAERIAEDADTAPSEITMNEEDRFPRSAARRIRSPYTKNTFTTRNRQRAVPATVSWP